MGPCDVTADAVAGTADGRRWSTGPIADDELERLALAADPDAPLAPDATPVALFLASHAAQDEGHAALPEWYMAPVRARLLAGWHRMVILAVVGAFLVIEAVGLCSTFGQPPLH